MTKKKGIGQLSGESLSRRGFLSGSGIAAMSAVLGASIPFARYMPAGLESPRLPQ